jgi:hypothetical protein
MFPSNTFRCAVTALVIWASGATGSIAAGGAFTRGCAARDMQVMSMLEISALSPDALNDALHMMIDARMTCFQGQVVDALAIYETIVRRLPAD